MSKQMTGAAADDTVIAVPQGTTVRDLDTGQIVGDLVEQGQELVVAKGGRGGRGNIHFASPKNPAPEIAENGEPGEDHYLELELKMLADVGLIGFPSVGKSTLLSVVTGAKPKIAAYEFTTLVPNLGMVMLPDGRDFAMADMPGLINGASKGVGLGLQFLRHIERTGCSYTWWTWGIRTPNWRSRSSTILTRNWLLTTRNSSSGRKLW